MIDRLFGLTIKEIRNEGEWETGADDEQVSHCQIGEENVGDALIHGATATTSAATE